jgi:pimeloyl-ACP methyl ester carboxylesterase
MLGYIDQAWGSGGSVSFLAPSLANDQAAQQWQGRFERRGADPAAATALMRMNSQIDISDIVSTIRVPTLVIHRAEDATINVEGGRELAKHIPDAFACGSESEVTARHVEVCFTPATGHGSRFSTDPNC